MAIGFPEPGLGWGAGKLTRTALTERPGSASRWVNFWGEIHPGGAALCLKTSL